MIHKIEDFSAWIILLSGWHRLLIAFLAGAASSFAMAPFDAFPILFITMPILVWLLDGAYSDARQSLYKTARSAFALGWWFGFGYFTLGLWWIGNALLVEASSFAWMLPFAVLVIPAGLSIFWGVAAVFGRILWSENWTRIIALALALGLAEYLRGTLFTGFPWNTLGYAAMPTPIMMQSASVFGIYGVTPLAIVVFCAPLIGLTSNVTEPSSRNICLILALSLASAHMGFGIYRIPSEPSPIVEGVTLRVVQPNIVQIDKLNPEKGDETFQTYVDVSTKANLDTVTHLLWPESAFPFLLTERRDMLARIAEMLPAKTQLLTGAVRAEPSSGGDPFGRVYNSIYSIFGDGEIAAAADKLHLVPFGEYLPFQNLLETFGLEAITRIHGGFEAASNRTFIDGQNAGLILPLICYEIIFSGEFLQKSSTRPDWILNATNDAWYGHTTGPYQHLRQSIIRGVEVGLPVVRVANSGISSVSDPYGRTLKSLAFNQKGSFDSGLPVKAEITIFQKYRHLPFYFICLILAIISLAFRKNYR